MLMASRGRLKGGAKTAPLPDDMNGDTPTAHTLVQQGAKPMLVTGEDYHAKVGCLPNILLSQYHHTFPLP